jgi:hypothetical protein
MRKVSSALAICLAGVIAASCHRIIPATRPPYTIVGIVDAIDADALSLHHKSGGRVRIAFAPETAVLIRNTRAGIADIAVGMRIVVRYRLVDGAAVADEVHLFRTKTRLST